MANQRYYQFLYSKDAMLTRISGSMTMGTSGAVSSATGKGIEGIHKLPNSTGWYQIELDDNYNQLVGFDYWGQQGTTGAIINSGSFVVGTAYVVINPGNMTAADWLTTGYYGQDFGSPLGIPQVGQVFIANGVGTGGATSKAKALASTGISNIQLLPAQAMLTNQTPGDGSLFIIGTYNYSGALADPVAGSILTFDMYLRNSSVAF